MLTEELLQFQFPNDANTIGIPESQPQGLSPYGIGRTAIFCCEEDDSFKDSSGADFPCWKEGGCGDKSAQAFIGKLSRSAIYSSGD